MSRRDSKRNPAPPQMRPLSTAATERQLHDRLSAMPGARRTAASTDWPPTEMVTVAVADAKFAGRLGLINTALSQVNLVMGSGNLATNRCWQSVHPRGWGRSKSQSPTLTRTRKRSDRAPAIDGETHWWPSLRPHRRAGLVRQAAVLPEKFASTCRRAAKVPQSGEHFDRVATAEESITKVEQSKWNHRRW